MTAASLKAGITRLRAGCVASMRWLLANAAWRGHSNTLGNPRKVRLSLNSTCQVRFPRYKWNSGSADSRLAGSRGPNVTLLSRKADYALLILSYLYQHKTGGTARAIAEQFDLPRHFVANILNGLCQQEFVTSHRGVKGGYPLARV